MEKPKYFTIGRDFVDPLTLLDSRIVIHYKYPTGDAFNPTHIALAELTAKNEGYTKLSKEKAIAKLREVFTEDERFQLYLEALREASK